MCARVQDDIHDVAAVHDVFVLVRLSGVLHFAGVGFVVLLVVITVGVVFGVEFLLQVDVYYLVVMGVLLRGLGVLLWGREQDLLFGLFEISVTGIIENV